ncbi:hypothetical protein TWF481_000148 [Arthrobotrys musiformis]|uniref:F-box domain-containing protein n=1 Tax=Arthrobotrys musiformis TaxID=47236 RepID=A0AAV9WNR6_9PEZI
MNQSQDKIECLKKNAAHVRVLRLDYHYGNVHPLGEWPRESPVFELIDLLPGLREFCLLECVAFTWEGRCGLVGRLLARCPRLEKLSLWIIDFGPCPPTAAYLVWADYKLYTARQYRLKALDIYVLPGSRQSHERGEYIFKPFLNIFSNATSSLEEFGFNLEGSETTDMTAEEPSLNGLDPDGVDLASRPLSMPSLKFLDIDALCYFDNLSQFMTLDSFAKVTWLSILVNIRVLYPGVASVTAFKKDASELIEVLQHFPNLTYLWINMGDTINIDVWPQTGETIPQEFWDAWAEQLPVFCSVVPRLKNIRGQTDECGKDFIVLRSDDAGIVVKEAEMATKPDLVDAPNIFGFQENWYYWRKVVLT